MEETNKNLLLEKFSKNISRGDRAKLEQDLDKANDDAFETLNSVKLKNTWLTVLISFFGSAFGGGFFYLKQFKLAFTSLSLTVGFGLVAAILSILHFAHIDYVRIGFYIPFSVIILVSLFVIGILHLVFFFVSCFLVKQVNAQRIFTALEDSSK